MCFEVPILMGSPEVGSLDGMNPKPYTFRMGGKWCLLLGVRSLPLLRSRVRTLLHLLIIGCLSSYNLCLILMMGASHMRDIHKMWVQIQLPSFLLALYFENALTIGLYCTHKAMSLFFVLLLIDKKKFELWNF
jgi:hypothetical protein